MKKRGCMERLADSDIMAMTADVKNTGTEKRARDELYGYDALVEEFPDKEEAEVLNIWKRRVDNAPATLIQGGKLHIAKARRILVDVVDSNLTERRLQRQEKVADDVELEAVMTAQRQVMERTRKAVAHAMLALPNVRKMPAELADMMYEHQDGAGDHV